MTETWKPSILVADDDDDLRRMLIQALTRAGYAVKGAADGEEALALMRRAKPDLLILDLAMPNLDGFDVLKALKFKDADAPPVIVLTAFFAKDEGERALQLGAKDFLTKPIELVELEESVYAQLAARSGQSNRPKLDP